MSTNTDYKHTVACAIARGLCVQPLLAPIDAIKICYQLNTLTTLQTAQQLYQKEGLRAFFKGLPHQLIYTCAKQAWVWPCITTLPPFFKAQGMSNTSQQICTALTIALFDATISTPLEKGRIRAIASSEKIKFSLSSMYKNGWRGYTAHLARLSTAWTGFLLAQNYFRGENTTHTLPELIQIGAKTALVVSIFMAPVDIANTFVQAENRTLSHVFKTTPFPTLLRGFHLSATSLLAHNIASSIVYEIVA